MRYAGTERDDEGPWFRLGQLEVTTTVAVLLLWVASLIVWIVDRTTSFSLGLFPQDVASGEVWRIVTWPLAHEPRFSIWEMINAAIFWLFGSQLERQLGRPAFTVLMGVAVVTIGLAGTILGTVLGGETFIYGLDLLTLTVVLLFIAEHPTAPFFFGIPAWVIGAAIVALELVNDLADRDWVRMLTVIVAAAVIALVARRQGLLADYERVPEIRLPSVRREKPSRGTGGTARRAGKADRAARGADSKAPRRRPPLRRKAEDSGPGELIAMPDPPAPRRRPTPQSTGPEQTADDLALDALLDKISTGGMDALTDAERRELDELRARRRKQ